MGDLTKAIKEHMKMAAVLRESEGIKSLVEHSQETLDSGNVYTQPFSGKVSTIVTMGVQDERLNGGKETIIPTLWGGKPTDIETSIQNALQSGKKWPSALPDEHGMEEIDWIDKYAHIAIEKQTPVGENNAERKNLIP